MKNSGCIKGLILYSIYSAEGNIGILFFVTLAVNITMLITGIPTLFFVCLTFGIGVFPISLIINTHRDSASKWNKFQIAMPVRRKNVVASRYFANILILLVGIIMTSVFIMAGVSIHEAFARNAKDSILPLAPMMVAITLTVNAVFYPLIYTVGENKEEPFSVLCVGIAAGIVFLMMQICGWLNTTRVQESIFLITVPIFLVILSFMVTTKIYEKKDL